MRQFSAQVLVEAARAAEYTERYSGNLPSNEKMNLVGSKALKQWHQAIAEGAVDTGNDVE